MTIGGEHLDKRGCEAGRAGKCLGGFSAFYPAYLMGILTFREMGNPRPETGLGGGKRVGDR